MLHYYLTWLLTLKSEEGQAMAEYALLLALIAVMLVIVIYALAGGIGNIFKEITNILNEAPQNQIK